MPLLFFVCVESHEVARTIYTKCFGTETHAPITWFNFDRDTLYVDWGVAEAAREEFDEEDAGLEFHFSPDDLSEDVKLVQKLALFEGTYPYDLHEFVWIDDVLDRFGHVKSLTIVPPRLEEEKEHANLVYLEHVDVVESPEYLVSSDAGLHPLLWQIFPLWQPNFRYEDLWDTSNKIWSRERSVYNRSDRMAEANSQGEPRWKRSFLDSKPILTSEERLDFLHRKLEYDRERSNHSCPIR